MSRFRTALVPFLWAIAGVAHAQATLIPADPPGAVGPQPSLLPVQFLAASDESTPTPSAASAAPASPSDAEKSAAAIEKLSKTVETIGKNLTVVTADEQIKLVVGGVISADFFWNQARPVAPGIPFFLTPRSSFGFSQQTFDANARESTLFALVSGPKFCDFETSGFIAVCFFNDALIVDRYGMLPIQAYGQLKNDDWRFAAGLQFDIFNPLNPTVLEFSYLGGSGNAGAGFPGQLRVERYFHPDDDTLVTLTGGLSEPLSTTVNNTFRISEDNGWPNVEGRASVACGPLQGEGPTAKRAFEAGVSGVVGQLRTTQANTRVVADVWGVGCDCRWAITPCFGVQGEVFVGQSLGEYTAGILQTVNVVNFNGVHTSGGWIETYFYICPETLHTHIGYGIDDPLDGDLSAGAPVRNETYFANLIWDPTKHLRIGFEIDYRRTEYTLVRNNDGFGCQAQFQLKF